VKAAGSASEESEDEQSSRSSHHVPVYRCQCWPEVVERVKEVYQAKKDGRKPSSKKAIKCAGPHHPCFGRLPYIPLPYLSPVKFRMKHETPIPPKGLFAMDLSARKACMVFSKQFHAARRRAPGSISAPPSPLVTMV
jgi:hypothetical protein